MIGVYTLLNKKAKKRPSFEKTEEFKFFIDHRYILEKYPKFSFLYDSDDNEFNIMRANIVLRGLLNKEIIEDEIDNINSHMQSGVKVDHAKFVSTLREVTIDLPYLVDDKIRIYIPFFPRPLNYTYLKEPEKLLEYPYNELKSSFLETIIDPFDTYGTNLYNSLFTRLVNIGTNGKEVAFFHYDMNTIYIVNSQGRLDNKIVLFDKHIKHPSYSHMLERLTPVVKAYFSNCRAKFITELYANEFISHKLWVMLRGQNVSNEC